MKTVFVPFPTQWDRRQLAARGELAARYRIVEGTPSDADCPADCDVLQLIDDAAVALRGRIDGVFSSSDYPGAATAAALATLLGLPGAAPAAVIAAGHKLRAREIGRVAAPDATPAFAHIDPDRPDAPFLPCFVKPIKGAFSILTAHITTPADLRGFLANPAVAEHRSAYVRAFDSLARAFTDIRISGGDFLAEAVLGGRLITLEGFVLDGTVTPIGITDSVTDPATGSFVRFDYPSTLPSAMQRRALDIARRLVLAIGLDHTLFNVELFVDEVHDRVFVVEVNPRMCGQFADLYQKVDGVNGYDIALALAVGEAPRLPHRQGRYACAASFPLRVFEPTRVLAIPDAATRQAAEALRPDTQVWIECAAGDRLLDFAGGEDGRSARYAVINIGGDSAADVLRGKCAVEAALGLRLVATGPA